MVSQQRWLQQTPSTSEYDSTRTEKVNEWTLKVLVQKHDHGLETYMNNAFFFFFFYIKVAQ